MIRKYRLAVAVAVMLAGTDAPAQPTCPEATNLVQACHSQHKLCHAALQLYVSDPSQYEGAGTKCDTQLATCNQDAAKICACPKDVAPVSTGAVPAAGAPVISLPWLSIPLPTQPASGRGQPGLPVGAQDRGEAPSTADPTRGQGPGLGVATGGASQPATGGQGVKMCMEEIPAGELNIWLNMDNAGNIGDTLSNDYDKDGVPDFKVKKVAFVNEDGTTYSYAYKLFPDDPCDTCAPDGGFVKCFGPEGGDSGKHPCYNPSQKTDVCKSLK